MEFIDLKAQYERLGPDIHAGIDRVLRQGRYILGPEVEQLEDELRQYVGSAFCASCANGTDALQLALMAWGIGPGDAVFVPAFTFMSTAEVVSLAGATPVFADIDPDTFNLDPESLRRAVEEVERKGRLSPKAVVPVDLFGQPADYGAIGAVARRHGLHVLEDGAQGFGGAAAGRRACSFGDISITSFFPAKPLGCYGDGGAVFTDCEKWHDLIVSARSHGKGKEKYDHVRIGVNSRLDTLQAAILLVKLRAFTESELAARQRWAGLYTALLQDHVKTPVVRDGFSSSFAQYTLMLNNRDERDALKAHLKRKGIPSMVYYPKPLHRQEAYLSLGYEEGSLPNAERAAECVLSLPMHPYLTEDTVGMVAASVLEFLK